MDEVEVDDAMMKFGGSLRKKKIINVKSVRGLIDNQESYEIDGGYPMYIIYFGI